MNLITHKKCQPIWHPHAQVQQYLYAHLHPLRQKILLSLQHMQWQGCTGIDDVVIVQKLKLNHPAIDSGGMACDINSYACMQRAGLAHAQTNIIMTYGQVLCWVTFLALEFLVHPTTRNHPIISGASVWASYFNQQVCPWGLFSRSSPLNEVNILQGPSDASGALLGLHMKK